MASEMIERVAWALCPHLHEMLHGERKECLRCPGSSYFPGIDRYGTQFCRHMAQRAAKDAIAAMREPTEEMIEIGSVSTMSGEGPTIIYQAMIDAALT